LKLRKKIATITLLLLAFAPVFYAFTFDLRQHAIRNGMKEKLEKTVLRTLILNKDQIHWNREGKELTINNKLFDVRYMRVSRDGSITVQGLYDEDETLLVDQLNNQEQQNRSLGNKLLTQFLQIWLAVPTEPILSDLPAHTVQPQYPDISQSTASGYKMIYAPPPQA
jgi:hypothetical protein